ncbi:MAG: hypothetical protein MUC83_03135 [Pirellula sp.]|nr:hypothetical protein [Pirellula sp.]
MTKFLRTRFLTAEPGTLTLMEAMCYGSHVRAAQGDTHHPEMIRCEAFTCYHQPAIWAARRKRIHAHCDDSVRRLGDTHTARQPVK